MKKDNASLEWIKETEQDEGKKMGKDFQDLVKKIVKLTIIQLKYLEKEAKEGYVKSDYFKKKINLAKEGLEHLDNLI